MKKLFLLLPLTFLGMSLFAQVDLQVNPLGLLWSNFKVSAEVSVQEDIGIEANLVYNYFGFDVGENSWRNNQYGTVILGKYYFNVDQPIEGWNVGAYLKYRGGTTTFDVEKVNYTRMALGFYGGYKIVSAKNIIFEIGAGFGRALVSKYSSNDQTVSTDDFPLFNIDSFTKLSVGYRFGG